MMPDPVSDSFEPTTSIETTTGSTLAAIAAYDCALLVAADTVCAVAFTAAEAVGAAAAELPEPTVVATSPPAPPETSANAVSPAVTFIRPRERWAGISGGLGSQLGGGGGGSRGVPEPAAGSPA